MRGANERRLDPARSARRMTLLHHVPRPPLSDFVERLWLYDGFAPAHTRERVLPTGTMELIVTLRDARVPVVCGAHSESFDLETAAMTSIMGVHFKPRGIVRPRPSSCR